MKISEARKIYSSQIKDYNLEKQKIMKQKKELEEKMNISADGKAVYAKEAAVLELSLENVTKKQEEYKKYMEELNQQWFGIMQMESSRQQADAAEEYYQDLGKIMEVARRLMEGGIVPPQDEKKLMEYSMELYQTAKSMGAMIQSRKRKEYDSLWEEKKEDSTVEDPAEIADNAIAASPGPAVVDVSEVAATGSENE